MVKESVALLDGDIIAYRIAAYHTARCEGEVGPNLRNDIEEGAIDLAKEWVEKSGCQHGHLCLTDGPTFRNTINPTYKANRTDVVKPLYLEEAKQALMDTYEHCFDIHPGLEADDLLAMRATNDQMHSTEYVIVTIDKDLLQVPGHHFNPNKDTKVRIITESEGFYNLMLQWMTGDPTDNLKGMKGVGPKKAAKILQDLGVTTHTKLSEKEMRNITFNIAEQFERYNVPIKQALIEYRCIRILRYGEYDYDNNIPYFMKEDNARLNEVLASHSR